MVLLLNAMTASHSQTDREKDAADMLRTLREKRVELFGESDVDGYLTSDLCEIWVSFPTEPPLPIFVEFLLTVSREKINSFKFENVRKYNISFNVMFLSSVQEAFRRSICEMQTRSPLESFLRNYICHNPPPSNSGLDPSAMLEKLLTNPKPSASPAWAPEWYRLLKTCTVADESYWQSVESLFAPAFLLQAELREHVF